MIVENLKEGFKEGELEGRCVLASSFLFSLSIYLSNFDAINSILTMVVSAIFSKGKVLKFITGFTPVIILLVLSSIISGIGGIKVLLAFLAILCSGALITSSKYSEILGALVYFKFPERFVSYLSVTLPILPTVMNDLQNVKLIYGKSYYAMLKAFVATVVIRSASVGETLYSKNFSEKIYYEIRSPKLTDLALLSLSSLLFLSTILRLLLSQNI